jgi:hypothetical protein
VQIVLDRAHLDREEDLEYSQAPGLVSHTDFGAAKLVAGAYPGCMRRLFHEQKVSQASNLAARADLCRGEEVGEGRHGRAAAGGLRPGAAAANIIPCQQRGRDGASEGTSCSALRVLELSIPLSFGHSDSKTERSSLLPDSDFDP